MLLSPYISPFPSSPPTLPIGLFLHCCPENKVVTLKNMLSVHFFFLCSFWDYHNVCTGCLWNPIISAGFGWHHQFNGDEFKQTPGGSEGQGSLACCSPWRCKELDMIVRLNSNIHWLFMKFYKFCRLLKLSFAFVLFVFFWFGSFK